MQMTLTEWKRYRDLMSKISRRAADDFRDFVFTRGGLESVPRNEILDCAYLLVQKYGEASGAAACELYDELAALQNASVPAAEIATLPGYNDVAKAVNGGMKTSLDVASNVVQRLTKQVGADTMVKNAIRDGAELAWVPSGDTCAFCITLASRGWQRASKTLLKNGHAEHIHANCDCQHAVRFDGKSTVDGYDPQKYLELYNNAAPGGDSREKINSLRRQLSQRKNDKKIVITDQAIGKVKKIVIGGYSDDELSLMQEMNKKLLEVSKE